MKNFKINSSGMIIDLSVFNDIDKDIRKIVEETKKEIESETSGDDKE